jgi:hypothetical protein
MHRPDLVLAIGSQYLDIVTRKNCANLISINRQARRINCLFPCDFSVTCSIFVLVVR